MKRTDLWLLSLVVLALGALACSLPTGGQTGDGGADEGTPHVIYTGLGLDEIESYTANFEVTFTPDDATLTPWTYRSDMAGNDGGSRRTFNLTGISGPQNPGSMVLTRLAGQQYLSGPGVGAYFLNYTCIITPEELGTENPVVDVDESFLTPDHFLPPGEVANNLIPDGEDTVAGVEGLKYTIEADQLGRLIDVVGSMVVAKDGNYVLSYDLKGEIIDSRFTDARGEIEWHYRVDSLESERLSAPAECQPPYPIMPHGFGVTWLGDVLAYGSRTPRADIVAFYRQGLSGMGWQLAGEPEEGEGVTSLTFTDAGGQTLLVTVQDEQSGTSVTITLQ